MLIQQIINTSKNKPVYIYFDMDGTCAEYNYADKERIKSGEPDFYLHSRPMKTVLANMKKLAKQKNVTLGIVSMCFYPQQAADKRTWLAKYAPFIDPKNVHFIVLNETKATKETIPNLKAELLKGIKDKLSEAEFWLIEDQHNIIKATIKLNYGINSAHVSMFVD